MLRARLHVRDAARPTAAAARADLFDRCRITVMATHADEQVDRAVDALAAASLAEAA